MAKKTSEIPDFEKALDELEKLVDRMEEGDLSLEESLKSFERGMALSRRCRNALDQAHRRVDQVLARDDGESVTPLEDDGSGDAGDNA